MVQFQLSPRPRNPIANPISGLLNGTTLLGSTISSIVKPAYPSGSDRCFLQTLLRHPQRRFPPIPAPLPRLPVPLQRKTMYLV